MYTFCVSASLEDYSSQNVRADVIFHARRCNLDDIKTQSPLGEWVFKMVNWRGRKCERVTRERVGKTDELMRETYIGNFFVVRFDGRGGGGYWCSGLIYCVKGG